MVHNTNAITKYADKHQVVDETTWSYAGYGELTLTLTLTGIYYLETLMRNTHMLKSTKAGAPTRRLLGLLNQSSQLKMEMDINTCMQASNLHLPQT